jgi:hypothetical protein
MAIVPFDRALALQMATEESGLRLLEKVKTAAINRDEIGVTLLGYGLVPAEGPFVVVSFPSADDRDRDLCSVLADLNEFEEVQAALLPDAAG